MKSLRSKTKRQVAEALTPICAGLIYLLRNRSSFSLNRLELQSVQFSYSQFGEDLAVCRLADELGLDQSVYVDVQYLNIDCEGSDLAVIRGLQLDRCHPAILSIEAFGNSEREAIEQILALCGYRCEISIPPTMIFVSR